MRLEIFPDLGSIPLFNPDRTDLPPAVATLRASIQAADAVIFSTPEYAHGLPGALKNALDWLVSGIELTDKPVVLFNASPRSVYAQAALREVLVTLGARMLEDACVTIPLTADSRTPQQLVTDRRDRSPIAAALQRLAASVTALADKLHSSSLATPGPRIAALAAAPASRAPQLSGPLFTHRAARSRPARRGNSMQRSATNPAQPALTYLPANPPARQERVAQPS